MTAEKYVFGFYMMWAKTLTFLVALSVSQPWERQDVLKGIGLKLVGEFWKSTKLKVPKVQKHQNRLESAFWNIITILLHFCSWKLTDSTGNWEDSGVECISEICCGSNY